MPIYHKLIITNIYSLRHCPPLCSHPELNSGALVLKARTERRITELNWIGMN